MATRPVRRRLSAPERRSLILDAARAAFTEFGFAGARTRVIAQKAGITEAILYQHFASKEELFEKAVLEPVREQAVALVEAMRAALNAATEAGEIDREVLLRDLHTLVLNALSEMLPLLGVAIMADNREANADYRFDLYTATASVLGGLDESLGPVRRVADDPLLLTLLAMSIGPVLDAQFRETTLDVDAVATQTARLLTRGLFGTPSDGRRRASVQQANGAAKAATPPRARKPRTRSSA